VGEEAPTSSGSRVTSVATSGLGGLLGGLAGGFFVVGVTLLLKGLMDDVAGLATWVIIALPLLGVGLAVALLQGYGRGEGAETGGNPPRGQRWRTFARGVVRADIMGDVVASAGAEERFPWRLAPLRALAIFATVGLGGAMGTEAPAAYLGVAAGACVGDRGRCWRRLLRPAALAGGAAGVAALMGIPLVGTAYMLELPRERAPLTAERVTASLIGGLVGWGINVAFHLNLIRLVVPHVPPVNLRQAVMTALFIGVAAGIITSLAGSAFSRAKKWRASPVVRLVLGGLAGVVIALSLAQIAAPGAAVGPGGGAILWAENNAALPLTLLTVCLLRAAATTAVTAAGGCGGLFVPYLAIGDMAGRVFAPGLAIGGDLAGAAGAAGGLAGGYRLPLTAVAMVLGNGGPRASMLTCLATVAIAFLAAVLVDSLLKKGGLPSAVGKHNPPRIRRLRRA
jgi:CIC family chloride channel protein